MRTQALHFAAWHGNLRVLRTLLDLGADPAARNYYDQTPLHRAAAGVCCLVPPLP